VNDDFVRVRNEAIICLKFLSGNLQIGNRRANHSTPTIGAVSQYSTKFPIWYLI
jgi:hypothetical protein